MEAVVAAQEPQGCRYQRYTGEYRSPGVGPAPAERGDCQDGKEWQRSFTYGVA